MEGQKSVAEENREYWNSKTNFYEREKDWANKTAEQFTQELIRRREWIGLLGQKSSELRLLDVACGPGMMSHALFDFVGAARGIDIADRMVDTYNERAREKGLFPDQMSAVQGNIVATEASSEASISSPEYFDFDVVTMANALHHMEDPALTVRRLVQRLKPGGTLLIVEFINDPDDSTSGSNQAGQPSVTRAGHGHDHSHGHSPGHSHGHGHGNKNGNDGNGNNAGVAHHGFTQEQLQKFFVDAGCTEVDFVLMDEPIKFPPVLGSLERMSSFTRGKKSSVSVERNSSI